MYGFLDRIEDNDKAVILIEETKEELIVSIEDLPENSKENTWLKLEKNESSYNIIGIAEDKTKNEEESTSSLLNQLKKKKGSSFKR